MTVAVACSAAWGTTEPRRLAVVLAPDFGVDDPLGHIEGADRYWDSLARILSLTAGG